MRCCMLQLATPDTSTSAEYVRLGQPQFRGVSRARMALYTRRRARAKHRMHVVRMPGPARARSRPHRPAERKLRFLWLLADAIRASDDDGGGHAAEEAVLEDAAHVLELRRRLRGDRWGGGHGAWATRTARPDSGSVGDLGYGLARGEEHEHESECVARRRVRAFGASAMGSSKKMSMMYSPLSVTAGSSPSTALLADEPRRS